MIDISNRIKELRKQKKLTQKELAERIHVSQVAVNYWENGKREPSIGTLHDLANALDISYYELMTGLKDNSRTVGKNIKFFREQKGLTQKELADLSGIDYKSIIEYEENKQYASLEELKKIATSLNISEMELDNEILTAPNNDVYNLIIAKRKLNDAQSETIDESAYCYVGNIAVSDKNLLKEFHILNPFGKAEAIKRVSELKYIREYTDINEIPFE